MEDKQLAGWLREIAEEFFEGDGDTVSEFVACKLAADRIDYIPVLQEAGYAYRDGMREQLARAVKAETEAAEARHEVDEQARLLGMSAEREARLIAELAERDRVLDKLPHERRCSIYSYPHGRPCNCAKSSSLGLEL